MSNLTMVQDCGLMLGTIPKADRTAALCTAAVQQNGAAIYYVPDSKLTKVMKRAGIMSNPNSYRFLRSLDRQDLLDALNLFPMLMQWIKPAKQDDELVRIALLSSYEAIKFVAVARIIDPEVKALALACRRRQRDQDAQDYGTMALKK